MFKVSHLIVFSVSLCYCIFLYYCRVSTFQYKMPYNDCCCIFWCYINKIEMNFNYTIIISVYMSKIGDWFYSKDTDWWSSLRKNYSCTIKWVTMSLLSLNRNMLVCLVVWRWGSSTCVNSMRKWYRNMATQLAAEFAAKRRIWGNDKKNELLTVDIQKRKIWSGFSSSGKYSEQIKITQHQRGWYMFDVKTTPLCLL